MVYRIIGNTNDMACWLPLKRRNTEAGGLYVLPFVLIGVPTTVIGVLASVLYSKVEQKRLYSVAQYFGRHWFRKFVFLLWKINARGLKTCMFYAMLMQCHNIRLLYDICKKNKISTKMNKVTRLNNDLNKQDVFLFCLTTGNLKPKVTS